MLAKQAEMDRFNLEVSKWEQREYFELFQRAVCLIEGAISQRENPPGPSVVNSAW